ncbi:MAG: hypothetical protein FWC97_03020 [Treponema sp.]|nr:hypothetical protein [Treponema sp.]
MLKPILLTFFLLLSSFVYAQELRIGGTLTISVSPETLLAGYPFTLTFLVDYPAVDDVSVITPPIYGALTMDRFLRMPRMTEDGQVQTLIEFRLIPNVSGRIILNSFSIVTPHGVTETGLLAFDVQAIEHNLFTTLHFVWENNPQQLSAGERAVFSLRLNNSQAGNRQIQLPPQTFFMPEVPPGVILSRSQLSSREIEDGYMLRLSLIPLETGEFFLPARTLEQGNIRFEIPALRIRITERR